jgi:UDPglucose 6-dehydrogenase
MLLEKKVPIAVVGSGYVGLVAAACFAEIGHTVICVDKDEAKVTALKGGDPLIHEEYLPELLNKHRNKSIQFTTDLAHATEASDAIFIAVGTPQSETGDADLSYVEAVASEVARHLTSYKVIIEKSTVPVFTNSWIRRVIERTGVPSENFDVVSNPEFLREGTAVEDFLHPDRIVVGTPSTRSRDILDAIYAPLTDGSYYREADRIQGMCSEEKPPRILFTTTNSAEMIKHASNAFLALKISFINAVSNLCEAADADVEEVALGIGLDSRIGQRFLRPGVGYGGSCFPKDVAAFRAVAEQRGVNFNLLTEVEKINANQKKRFIARIRAVLWNLRGKKLGVLGLAFKGGTDDIRDSPALEIIEMLIAEGCSIRACDPAARKRAEERYPATSKLTYVDTPYEAAENVDALLILTDWKEFGTLDLAKLRTVMGHPTIIDGRNLYDLADMEAAGFTYVSIGRRAVYPQLSAAAH